jgi:sugar transferase (PEP-CTERM/EpsH1 system associated)
VNAPAQRRPLIAHVVHRLDMGGLENGLVNLLDALPHDRYQHAIICLTRASEFAERLRRTDVEVIALDKRPGHDAAMYARLWRTLRRVRPDVLHTRNSGALECLPVAFAAGVRRRVHGLHGWDMDDLDGSSRKHRMRQRLARPFVTRYVCVSRELAGWLAAAAGVSPGRITQIYNGVDTARFQAAGAARERQLMPHGFATADALIVGAVGRMEAVKDPLTLVKAFVTLARRMPGGAARLRLVYVGDGSLRRSALELLHQEGMSKLAWLPGARNDVPALLRSFDVFVLPSLNEGISNTILEAMATALPIVATRVGGNPELVVDNSTGLLVPAAQPVQLSAALARYAGDPALGPRHGSAGRARVERHFSLRAMVAGYRDLYDSLLGPAVGRLATGDV